jgi:hypothetical protein
MNRRAFLSGLGLAGGLVAPSTVRAAVPSKQRRDSGLGYKLFILDFQFSDLDPDTLKYADPDRYADAMAEMGVESLLVYSNNVYGFTFFDSAYGPKLKNLPDDFLDRYIAACHRRNIKTVLYHSVFWQEHVYLRHPDWALIGADGKPVRFVGQGVEGGVTYLCINSPFRQVVLDEVGEIARRFPFDAWFVDEFFYHPAITCYNPFCLAKWKSRRGTELSRPVNREDFPDYLDFMVETYSSLYGEIKATLKAAGRDVPTTHNLGLDYTHDDFIVEESNPKGFDFYQLSVRTKLFRAYANGRQLQMIPHRGNEYTDYTGAPQPELNWQAATILAHNAAVMWADQANVDGTLDSQLIAGVREANRVADALIPKVRGTVPYAEVLLLASERDFYLSHSRDFEEFYGANKLLSDLHWPFDVLEVRHLAEPRLSECRLLIIGQVQHLSSEQAGIILRYLEAGGNVLITGATGVRDERGRLHARPCLGLLDIRQTGYERAYLKPAFPISDARIKITAPFTVTPPDGARVLATLIRPAIYRSETSPFSDAPYPGQVTPEAVMVAGTRGRGRFIYAGWEFFRSYVDQNLPVFGEALRGMLDGHYEPRVLVEAPTVVEAVYNRIGSELRITLVNGMTSRPAGGAMWGDANRRGYVNITETIPVHDIRIRIRDRTARAASSLNGTQLRIFGPGRNGSIIEVPRLEQYDLISVDVA